MRETSYWRGFMKVTILVAVIVTIAWNAIAIHK